MWQELHELPEELLDLEAGMLAAHLEKPTLVHLPGRQPEPLFVSLLLHGNEYVGWDAVRDLLADYHARGRELPRALSLFIGNVRAAAEGRRTLDGQPDFNRVWPGTETPRAPEARMMAEIVERMHELGVFASVDLHNNTGLNPHYACVNVLRQAHLHLATLFSRTVVYFVRPVGVQSMAFSELCPAVTLECGKVGDEGGLRHARDFIDACLHLTGFPSHPVPREDIDLFHTVATVKVPPNCRFSFHGEPAAMQFVPDLERLNFSELPPGTAFALVDDGCRLDVVDEQGRPVFDEFFRIEEGRLLLTQAAMPAMLTSNEAVVRQDCLCYLMERHPYPPPSDERNE